jgi:hypothetical protein
VAIGALAQNHRGNDASHGIGGGGSFGSGGCFGAGLVCARPSCSYNNANGVTVNASIAEVIIAILSGCAPIVNNIEYYDCAIVLSNSDFLLTIGPYQEPLAISSILGILNHRYINYGHPNL